MRQHSGQSASAAPGALVHYCSNLLYVNGQRAAGARAQS